METRKLYYENCHLRSFTAKVLSCQEAEGVFQVCLDATAFYPEGGGQPWDQGTLNGIPVTQVHLREGQVVHTLTAPLTPGDTVEGQLDWPRRFDAMQQHTGEHILSGILCRRFGVHNVGFHMGAETVTIDFDGPISQEALEEAEQEANQYIWESLPVRCWYPTPEDLPKIPYRSKKALAWPVRLVEVPGADCCACCGVHVAATGEIGLLKTLSLVKFHQGVRIEMVCGGRAFRYLAAVFDQNRRVSRILSAEALDTARGAQALKDQLAAEKFRAVGFQRRIFDTIGETYAGAGNVVRFEPGLTGEGLQELARRISARSGGFAAVFTPVPEGHRYCLAGPENLAPLNKALTTALKGRGGGKPNLQQGTLKVSQAEIEAFFQNQKF